MQMIRVNILNYKFTVAEKITLNLLLSVLNIRIFVAGICLLMHSFIFAEENTIHVNNGHQYQRIISAGGSITEIAAHLGITSKLIAVDSSSTYPDQVNKLPKIGYFRALNSEGVLALEPDLFVAARGAGPDKVLAQIENAGVPVVQFEQSTYSLENWETLVSSMGAFFNRRNEATKLIKKTRNGIKTAKEAMHNNSKPIRVLALLNAGNRGFTVAGKNTVPDLLLKLIGVENVAKDLDGYKPYDSESLASQDIDLILAPNHTVDAMGGTDGICGNASIKMATMKTGCRVHVMHALLLLGFGARLEQAATEIVAELAN